MRDCGESRNGNFDQPLVCRSKQEGHIRPVDIIPDRSDNAPFHLPPAAADPHQETAQKVETEEKQRDRCQKRTQESQKGGAEQRAGEKRRLIVL